MPTWRPAFSSPGNSRVPVPPEDLVRGSVCLALYPFTPGFPLEQVVREAGEDLIAQLDRHETIESIASSIRPQDPPTEVVVQAKLRRVLLLQEGTSPSRQDVTVARIGSITDRLRRRRGWYARLQDGVHPAALLIGREARHGTGGTEAYVNLLSVAPIGKQALLRKTGSLTEDEMRLISERLVTALELDISGLVRR